MQRLDRLLGPAALIASVGAAIVAFLLVAPGAGGASRALAPVTPPRQAPIVSSSQRVEQAALRGLTIEASSLGAEIAQARSEVAGTVAASRSSLAAARAQLGAEQARLTGEQQQIASEARQLRARAAALSSESATLRREAASIGAPGGAANPPAPVSSGDGGGSGDS